MPEKLSYSKFNTLVEKYGYLITTIYYIEQDMHKRAVFLECRLPKTQKNVLVHIPSKFKMSLTKDLKPKLIEIVKSDRNEDSPNIYGHLSDKSVSYILNLRGPMINSDIAVISIDGICMSKFNGTTVCYHLKSSIIVQSDDESGHSSQEEAKREAEELHKIEQDLIKAAAKMKIKKSELPEKTKIQDPVPVTPILIQPELPPELKAPMIEASQPVEGPQPAVESAPSQLETPDQVQPTPDKPVEIESEPVELVFQPETVEIHKPEIVDVPEKSDHLDEASLSSSSSDSSEEIDPKSSKESKKLRMSQRSNYVDVEELDVQTGIVYVVVDVEQLYKKLDDYESYAISVYEQLDDNEKDMRSDRIAEIKKQLDLASKHLDLRIKKLEISESGSKYNLLKLTGLLQDAENIKSKASEAKKIAVFEIDKVHAKTKKAIHELNISILRQKDELDDILLNYEESLKELFEL